MKNPHFAKKRKRIKRIKRAGGATDYFMKVMSHAYGRTMDVVLRDCWGTSQRRES